MMCSFQYKSSLTETLANHFSQMPTYVVQKEKKAFMSTMDS